MIQIPVQDLKITNADQETIHIMHKSRLKEEGYTGFSMVDAWRLYEIHAKECRLITRGWLNILAHRERG